MAPMGGHSDTEQAQRQLEMCSLFNEETLIFKPKGMCGAGMVLPSDSPPQTRLAKRKAPLQSPRQRQGCSSHSPHALGLHPAGGEPREALGCSHHRLTASSAQGSHRFVVLFGAHLPPSSTACSDFLRAALLRSSAAARLLRWDGVTWLWYMVSMAITSLA